MDTLRKKYYSKTEKQKLLKAHLLFFAITKKRKYKCNKNLIDRVKNIFNENHISVKRIITKLSYIKNSHLFQLIHEIAVSFKYTFKFFGIHAFAAFFMSLFILGVTFWTHEAVFKDLPSPQDLTQKEQNVSTKILDRNGEVLFRIYQDENRSIVPLSSVPKHMIYATIAIEDKDFYHHHGFSIRGISRAIISNLQGQSLQGGSTLTQQLVKNRLLTSKRTFSRKIKELLLSVLVETTYSKDEIMEMYLNQVAYGGSTYGVEEAAQKYFGKAAKNLTLAESAMLAGLPQRPSAYTPFGSNPELAFARQEEVLRRMVEDGYISKAKAEEARKEPLVFNKNEIDIQAPHFVMYIKKLLANQFGEELLNKGGLEVRTTLDLNLQNQVDTIVYEEIQSLKHLNVKNGAAMVTNPNTGEILAMVGSVNYFDFENDGQVNVTLRPRQPGSSIKPVTYALALENNKTPASLIMDTPITYHSSGAKPYSPKNYDGKFHGKVTLKEALASSYNIPAVKTLAEQGIDNLIDLAEEMGITTWKDRNRFGLSLTLGGGEITMLDMTEVYGTFASGGEHIQSNPIIEITDYTGKVYYKNKCVLKNIGCADNQVISPETAYLISNILSDNDARTPAFGPLSTLHIPDQEVSVKTGTTNNLRDNWTIGYTSDVLVSVWVGNNDNTSMSYVASGITGASPIWNKIMRLNLSEENPHTFSVPENIISVPVCKTSRYLPCDRCPKIVEEFYLKGTEPGFSCNNLAKKNLLRTTNNQSNQNDKILEGAQF